MGFCNFGLRKVKFIGEAASADQETAAILESLWIL